MAEFSRGTSGAIVAECQVLNLTPPSKIGSGICFLDHMLDQLTSHAQLGVTLRCGLVHKASAQPRAEKDCFAPLKDYATGLSSRPLPDRAPSALDVLALPLPAPATALRTSEPRQASRLVSQGPGSTAQSSP